MPSHADVKSRLDALPADLAITGYIKLDDHDHRIGYFARVELTSKLLHDLHAMSKLQRAYGFVKSAAPIEMAFSFHEGDLMEGQQIELRSPLAHAGDFGRDSLGFTALNAMDGAHLSTPMLYFTDVLSRIEQSRQEDGSFAPFWFGSEPHDSDLLQEAIDTVSQIEPEPWPTPAP